MVKEIKTLNLTTQCVVCKRILEYTKEDVVVDKYFDDMGDYGETYYIQCLCGHTPHVHKVV